MLNMLLRALEPQARRILELRFRDDLLQSQIARRVGVSQMRGSRSISESIEQPQRAAHAAAAGPLQPAMVKEAEHSRHGLGRRM